MDVYVDTVENDSIYWGWVAALFTVESEIPSFATVCAACDANDTHVHNTKEGPRLQLGEIASLYFREKINTNPVCENIRFSGATRADGNIIHQAKRERFAK